MKRFFISLMLGTCFFSTPVFAMDSLSSFSSMVDQDLPKYSIMPLLEFNSIKELENTDLTQYKKQIINIKRESITMGIPIEKLSVKLQPSEAAEGLDIFREKVLPLVWGAQALDIEAEGAANQIKMWIHSGLKKIQVKDPTARVDSVYDVLELVSPKTFFTNLSSIEALELEGVTVWPKRVRGKIPAVSFSNTLPLAREGVSADLIFRKLLDLKEQKGPSYTLALNDKGPLSDAQVDNLDSFITFPDKIKAVVVSLPCLPALKNEETLSDGQEAGACYLPPKSPDEPVVKPLSLVPKEVLRSMRKEMTAKKELFSEKVLSDPEQLKNLILRDFRGFLFTKAEGGAQGNPRDALQKRADDLIQVLNKEGFFRGLISLQRKK